MLGERDLDGFFAEHFHRTAFRLNARDHYAVASDGADLARYLAGEPAPDPARKNAWLDELRADTAAGKRWQFIQVVREPLSDYLRYACEWGYAVNITAGAEVRILDLTGRHWAYEGIAGDFWLLDDSVVLDMHYDGAGRFLGATPTVHSAEVLSYAKAAQSAAWHLSVPFTDWWESHPQYHRAARVA